MTTVNPVSKTTYVLQTDNSILTFGATTNINAASGDGIYGKNDATSWLITTKGSVTGTTGVELQFISAYTNAGVVTGASGAGVSMTGGGLFTNAAGASINATGAGGWGFTMGTTGGGYGSVDNTFANHGLIDGGYGGVQLAGAVPTARNSGVIEGGVTGLAMNGGGTFTNSGTIIGTSQTGAYFGSTAQFTDNGTVTGGVNAVQFAGSGANSLTLGSGAKVSGAIVGSTAAGATTTLSLNGGGTLNSSLQHITSATVSGGGTWVLNGVSSLPSLTVAAGSKLQVGDSTHTNADLSIQSLQNNGVIKLSAGTLEVHDMSGSGSISFTGSASVLQLDHSASSAGAVAGFTTGAALDLRDIAFVGSKEAAYQGTSTAGTLTVSDGTHTAKIAVTGALGSGAFVAQSDGHGGTLIYEPTVATNSALASLLHQSLGVNII